MNGDATRSVLPAEVSLVAVSGATVVGFSRLFDGTSFTLPLTLSVVAAHGLAMVTRHRGWGLLSSAAVSTASCLLAGTWSFYATTTGFGLPTRATAEAVLDDLDAAWSLFGEVVAPAHPETGFLVALVVALWVAAFLADWAAFRIWSPVEAIVPASALFAFSSLLGADEHRVAAAGIFSLAVGAFLLTHRAAEQAATGSWIRMSTIRGGGLALGVTLAATSVVTGMLIGPALPGAADPGLVGWRDPGGDPGARVTVSPMVSIRAQLVEQSDVEVFTVEASERSYWRLTSLDTFDGEIWKSRGDYDDAGGRLPSGLGPEVGTETSVQSYTIGSLSSLWLPAAFEPRRIDAPGVDVVYEESSSTLIVGSEHQSSDGISYRVESTLPRFDPDELRSAGSSIPSEIAERNLQLPPGLSGEVGRLATEVTAGADGPYEQARALQDFFRQGFTYDVEVASGHDIHSIEDFLRARRGYCEQFAGTFAVMARSIGLPARVAVGFTPGEQDATNPDLWHVTGRQAHAWPEVYMSGAGWVAFEPTPGRGAPFAESYTGVSEQQEGETAQPADPDTTATTTATTLPDLRNDETGPGDLADTIGTGGAQAAGDQGADRWSGPSMGALVLLSMGLAYGAGVILLKGRRSRKRRDTARDRRSRVRLAWTETAENISVAGVHALASDTHHEYVRRVAERLDLDGRSLSRLAELGDTAEYAAEEPSDADVAEVEELAEQLQREAAELVGLPTRLMDLLDPRPLIRPRRPRRVSPPPLGLRTGQA